MKAFPVHDLDVVERITLKLLQYCMESNWAGYDPYDGLNSELFQRLRFLNFKWARLAFMQGLKRSPVNLRPLVLVPKTHNPKGLAVSLSALVKLSRLQLLENDELPSRVAGLLMELRTKKTFYSCWGYNFDWQTRTKLVPKGFPNIICTT